MHNEETLERVIERTKLFLLRGDLSRKQRRMGVKLLLEEIEALKCLETVSSFDCESPDEYQKLRERTDELSRDLGATVDEFVESKRKEDLNAIIETFSLLLDTRKAKKRIFQKLYRKGLAGEIFISGEFYKGKYMIAVYTATDELLDIYNNVHEAAKGLRLSYGQAKNKISRCYYKQCEYAYIKGKKCVIRFYSIDDAK